VPGCGVPDDPNKLDRELKYDAIYRLTSATGREHDLPPPSPIWQEDDPRPDITLTRRYMQNYKYDPAGNMTELKHSAPNAGSFRRIFEMVAGNNRLQTVRVGTTKYDYIYDHNGNMTQETLSRI